MLSIHCTNRAFLALDGLPRLRFWSIGILFATKGTLQNLFLIEIPIKCLQMYSL